MTIHRRLGHVDAGDLRQGFQVEQTLCLHHANFKVRWRLAELEAPLPRRLGGQGPGRLARADRRAAHAARRRRPDALRLPQRVRPAGRLPRPHGGAGARRRHRRARGEPLARAAQAARRALSPAARRRWIVTCAGPSCGMASSRQAAAACVEEAPGGRAAGVGEPDFSARGGQARQQREQLRHVARLVEHVGGEHERPGRRRAARVASSQR